MLPVKTYDAVKDDPTAKSYLWLILLEATLENFFNTNVRALLPKKSEKPTLCLTNQLTKIRFKVD